MRALEPHDTGFIERDGVRVFYEVYGTREPTIMLLPTWSLVHSRRWKAQIPYLARHFRVVTFDGRGNGRSDRPETVDAYDDTEFVADALAVMDATRTQQAVMVGISAGADYVLRLAADERERVLGAVFIGAAVRLGERIPELEEYSFDEALDTDEGWAKYNRHYWLRDYRGFAEWFCAESRNEPHSLKAIEDCVEWALETTPGTLLVVEGGRYLEDEAEVRALAARVRCPCLVVHGTHDTIVSPTAGIALAELLGAELVLFAGCGHSPDTREPVRFNLLLREFVERIVPPLPRQRTWPRAHVRPKRALFISSPIGLGHARRDVAIADELRALRPDLEIAWLAQHPVTEVLQARGETIHPASADLASESRHIEGEAGEHELNVYQAGRRMDEILLANFMVFRDLMAAESYDLWIGDEAWELDYYLHENPEEKRAAYAWLSDFVGFLPMPAGGAREELQTADQNAEMIEQIARYPRIRDRSIFIGDPDDIVSDAFGPGLPAIREWTERHYAFSGYITGFDPMDIADRDALRADLGYDPDERVCVVAVGGSGVGHHLMRRAIEAFPEALAAIPNLRMIAIAGPRIDLSSLPNVPGVEVWPYVDRLYRHLAACDLAVVQGGLTTTMELVVAKRPFLYFPLRNHFEQQIHVHHRLNRYGAGQCMAYASTTPARLAAAMAEQLERPVAYRDIAPGGAARAAGLIAELL
jgi:pimeloyl-ACP methyl ester carboxylesterase/predicted glycosyltransferase